MFASRGRVTVPSSMGKEAGKEGSPVWACREPKQASRGFGGVRPCSHIADFRSADV